MPNPVNTRVTITVVPKENDLTKETPQGREMKTVDPQRPEIPITESLNAMEIIGTTRPKILPIKGKIVANEIHLPKKINPEGENRINLKIEQTRSEKKQILIRKKIRHRRSQFWEAFYPRFLVAKLST